MARRPEGIGWRQVGAIALAVVLLLHGVAAVAWWWAMPGGFPVTHPRFLANRIAPAALLALVALGLFPRARRHHLTRGAWVALPFGWAAALACATLAYPLSLPAVPLAGLAALTLAGAVLAARGTRAAVGWAIAGVAMGALLPPTQRAPDADTRPAEPLGSIAANAPFEPTTGRVLLERDGLRLVVMPLLDFEAISPDRCWTLFAPRSARVEALLATSRASLEVEHGLLEDGGPSARIVARQEVEREIYGHLVQYAGILVQGHRSLGVSFSPAPRERIALLPSDYPTGRPARFATLDASGRFRVLEAADAEKGPFRELANGRLERGEPLEISLLDAGRRVARIVLEDWSAQLSTQRSPTAGWGVPVNAIQFGRTGDAPSSPAYLRATLADTAIGRGFDSVGHGKGTYRNRMRVELSGDHFTAVRDPKS